MTQRTKLDEVFRRRAALLGWLRETWKHQGLTATEIVDVSGLYSGHYRYDRCFDDLVYMSKRRTVFRETGRPARWWPS